MPHTKEFTVPAERIRVIPVSADQSCFGYLHDATASVSAGTVFTVLFFGAYIPLQGVDVIVRSAKLLSGESIEFS